jgi:hypothetical protein
MSYETYAVVYVISEADGEVVAAILFSMDMAIGAASEYHEADNLLETKIIKFTSDTEIKLGSPPPEGCDVIWQDGVYLA